MYTKYTLS